MEMDIPSSTTLRTYPVSQRYYRLANARQKSWTLEEDNYAVLKLDIRMNLKDPSWSSL